MIGIFVKLFLAVSFLHICFHSGDAASFTQVTSLVSETVEQSMPSRVYANVYGHGRQFKRFKREVVTKILEDPDGCIQKCRENETDMALTAMLDNIHRLALLIKDDLKGVKDEDLDDPAKEEAFKNKITKKTIENMGPFFQDLCSASTATDKCFAECPSSQLKNITVLDHSDAEVTCEPSKNWESFTEYWNAINCTNATEAEQPCDNKCGRASNFSSTTQLQVEDEDEGGASLSYENDSKKNAAALGPACKSTACQIDCYKPIMTERCGAKAYEMYARLAKIDLRTTLKVLKELNAIEDIPDCKIFQ